MISDAAFLAGRIVSLHRERVEGAPANSELENDAMTDLIRASRTLDREIDRHSLALDREIIERDRRWLALHGLPTNYREEAGDATRA